MADRVSAAARRRVGLFIILLSSLALAQLGSAQSIGLPVIFVHGYCDGPESFLPAERDAKANLQNTYPSLYGSSQEYITYYDGKNVWFQTPPTIPNGDAGAATPTVPANSRFFLVALHDPSVVLPSYQTFTASNVAGVPIFKKGNELANIIWAIKAITQAPRVIVVGHSMGGLDARAYLEGRASPTGDLSTAVPYLNDIAALVTLDTPHQGAPIAWLADFGGGLLGPLAAACMLGGSLHQSTGDAPLRPREHYSIVKLPRSNTIRQSTPSSANDYINRQYLGSRARGLAWIRYRQRIVRFPARPRARLQNRIAFSKLPEVPTRHL